MGFFKNLFGSNAGQRAETYAIGWPQADYNTVRNLLKEEVNRAYDRFWLQEPKRVEYERSEEERYAVYDAMSTELLLAKAQSGDPDAQYAYGNRLSHISAENEAETFAWFRKSAAAGNGDALFGVGVFYLHGFGGVTVDEDKAVEYLTKAAAAGRCYDAAEELTEIFSERVTGPNSKAQDLRSFVPWVTTCAWAYMDDDEEVGPAYAIRSLTALNTSVVLDYETLFSIGLEHTNEVGDRYEKILDTALMQWYFYLRSRDTGILAENPDIDIGEAEILGYIGEAALELKKPYAMQVLRVAADMGYANAISSGCSEAMEAAEDMGVSYEQRSADSGWRTYYAAVQKQAMDSTFVRSQAHALYALWWFLWFGFGCIRDREAAVAALRRAVDLKYSIAAHMLRRVYRTPNGEYELH